MPYQTRQPGGFAGGDRSDTHHAWRSCPGSTADRAPLLAEEKKKFHILVAEDNVVNQRLALRLLEKRGHNVMVVANGREALRVLDQQKFDVVFMDVQMPEMDGFEATAAIRAREQSLGGHLPIIAMTAHAMKGDRERCLQMGMDGYISKPIRAQELYHVLGNCF